VLRSADVSSFFTFIAVTTRRRDVVNRKLVRICSDRNVTVGAVRRVSTLFQRGTFCLETARRADDSPVG